MNFKFSNLLGAPYRGGNLLIHSNELLSAVGNRVSLVDLVGSSSSTLPFESLKQIRVLALNAEGTLLFAIDQDGKALIIQKQRRVLLHHFSFRGSVAAAKFSPNGAFIACAVGHVLQVWHTPSFSKSMAPMRLHRSYGGCHGDITALDWSPDSSWIAVAAKDLCARVFSLSPIDGYKPPTLAGHRDTPVAVFFTGAAMAAAARASGVTAPSLVTISRDGALFLWRCNQPAAEASAGPGQQQVQQAAPVPAKRMADDEGGQPGGKRRKHVRDSIKAEGPGRAQPAGSGGEGSIAEPMQATALPDARAEQPDEDEPDFRHATAPSEQPEHHAETQSTTYAGGSWEVAARHFFHQRGAQLTCADLHPVTGLLVAGFNSGIFQLHQLPEFCELHTLSVSREAVSTAAWNARGDWLALGCARLGQLLVWEWRSQSYVLQQQGHHFDAAALAFSPDGSLLATGADDAKVKMWTPATGMCFATFAEHTAPVTALAFLPHSGAVVSASLDGTVRAWDLLRYRNFRIMTTPDPVQFASLAADPSGEVVCAGGLDTFHIYVWAVKTGRLLDILAAHEAPVAAMAFSPTQPLLASASWDATVRTWDVFSGKGGIEVLQHEHDVLGLAFRPDGKLLATATLDGQIHLWHPMEAELQGTIEGRRDIAGGRLSSSRRTGSNVAAGACFTSLAFSADGSWLLAAGASKYICMYDVAERLLLRRVQISHNGSLDGILDSLNSRHVTDAGPVGLIDDAASDEDELLPSSSAGGAAGAATLPGTGAERSRPAVRCRAVALSPTGRAWAAASTEGILLHSLDPDLVFDPSDLAEDVTPGAVRRALKHRQVLKALCLALRLRQADLIPKAIMATPISQVPAVAAGVPSSHLADMLTSLADLLASAPHLEYVLVWVKAVCVHHAAALAAASKSGGTGGGTQGTVNASAAAAGPPLRALARAVSKAHEDLSNAAEGNLFALDYLCAQNLQPARSEGTDRQGL